MAGGKLTDVDVEFISLVKKGANGKPVTIYKSAEYKEKDTELEGAESMKDQISKEDVSIVKTFLDSMRKFFGGDKAEVAKSADIDTSMDYTSFLSRINNPERRFDNAISALQGSIWNIFWDSEIEGGKDLILKNIDDFKAHVLEILNNPVEVQKSFFQKEAETVVIEKEEKEEKEEVEENTSTIEGGEDTMKAEDIAKMLEPITKGIETLNERIEGVEKQFSETVEVKVEKTAEKTEEVAEKVEKAEEAKDAIVKSLELIQKSLDTVGERLTTLENVRGISKGKDHVDVEKSNDAWSGILNF